MDKLDPVKQNTLIRPWRDDLRLYYILIQENGSGQSIVSSALVGQNQVDIVVFLYTQAFNVLNL